MDPERPACVGAPWRWGTNGEMWAYRWRGWSWGGGCVAPRTPPHSRCEVSQGQLSMCSVVTTCVFSSAPDDAVVNTPPCWTGAPEVTWHIWHCAFLPCSTKRGHSMAITCLLRRQYAALWIKMNFLVFVWPGFAFIQIRTFPRWPVVMFSFDALQHA